MRIVGRGALCAVEVSAKNVAIHKQLQVARTDEIHGLFEAWLRAGVDDSASDYGMD